MVAAAADAPVNSANRFAHIDAMRAVAVTLVLVQHAGLSFVPGDSGVIVFFAISGFIITSILTRERDKSGGFAIGRFYRRRVIKLAPPFLLVILIPSVIYSFFEPVSWKAVLSQVFFSYNWVQIYDSPASYLVLPGSNVVWSLAVEEQFYIVFALIWLGLVRVHWWRRALVALSVFAVVYAMSARVWLSIHGDAEHVLRGTDVRMDGIAWGVLAALAYHSWRNGGSRWVGALAADWVPVVAIAAFLAVSAVGSDQYEAIWRNAVLPLTAVVMILYGLVPTQSPLHRLFYRVSAWRLVSLVGLASYSIYIAHYVVVEPLFMRMSDVVVPVRAVSLLAIGLGVGIALYFAVERPVLALRERLGL